MICKFCGKNINNTMFSCSKCRNKQKNDNNTHIPNDLEYIAKLLNCAPASKVAEYSTENCVVIKPSKLNKCGISSRENQQTHLIQKLFDHFRLENK